MKIITLILFSTIKGILLSPIFIIYSLTKKNRWKLIKGIYKDWLKG